MSELNWDRSYRVVFGKPAHEKEAYFFEGQVVTPDELSVINASPEAIRKPLTLDATTEPAGDVISMSNLVSEGDSARGFLFRLKTTRKAAANSASAEKSILTLYNLDKESIAVLNQEGCVVRVYAGYGGIVNLVYAGDVSSISIKDIGSDIAYNVTCKDGAIDIKNTKVSLEYDESLSTGQVLRDLISRFPSASLGKIATAIIDKKFVRGGHSVQGNLLMIFEKMCKRNGLTYSRYNGKISVRPEQLVQGTPDYLFMARNTFTLESDVIKALDPVMDNKTKLTTQKNVKRGIQLTTFLIPITLDQFISVPDGVSQEFAGTYKITTLEINLDSRKGPWDISVRAEPM